MSRGWKTGSTRQWRRIRATVLARDGYRCQLQLPGTWTTRDGKTQHCRGTAGCVHHTLGKTITGDDPRYLVAACTPCNLHIGDPTRQPDPPGRSATRW